MERSPMGRASKLADTAVGRASKLADTAVGRASKLADTPLGRASKLADTKSAHDVFVAAGYARFSRALSEAEFKRLDEERHKYTTLYQQECETRRDTQQQIHTAGTVSRLQLQLRESESYGRKQQHGLSLETRRRQDVEREFSTFKQKSSKVMLDQDGQIRILREEILQLKSRIGELEEHQFQQDQEYTDSINVLHDSRLRQFQEQSVAHDLDDVHLVVSTGTRSGSSMQAELDGLKQRYTHLFVAMDAQSSSQATALDADTWAKFDDAQKVLLTKVGSGIAEEESPWHCKLSSEVPVCIHSEPSQDVASATDEFIEQGAVFTVQEELVKDGATFLRLENGKGWVVGQTSEGELCQPTCGTCGGQGWACTDDTYDSCKACCGTGLWTWQAMKEFRACKRQLELLRQGKPMQVSSEFLATVQILVGTAWFSLYRDLVLSALRIAARKARKVIVVCILGSGISLCELYLLPAVLRWAAQELARLGEPALLQNTTLGSITLNSITELEGVLNGETHVPEHVSSDTVDKGLLQMVSFERAHSRVSELHLHALQEQLVHSWNAKIPMLNIPWQ